MRRRLCAGHEDGSPVWQIRGIRNTVALGSSINPSILQLIERFGFSGRLVVGAENGLSIGCRSILILRSVDDSNEGTLHGRFSLGRSRTLSRFDEVGADVRLRPRLTDLADENVYATKGDPVPKLNRIGLGTPSRVVDVDPATTTLGHPAHNIAFESLELALQDRQTIVR